MLCFSVTNTIIQCLYCQAESGAGGAAAGAGAGRGGGDPQAGAGAQPQGEVSGAAASSLNNHCSDKNTWDKQLHSINKVQTGAGTPSIFLPVIM